MTKISLMNIETRISIKTCTCKMAVKIDRKIVLLHLVKTDSSKEIPLHGFRELLFSAIAIRVICKLTPHNPISFPLIDKLKFYC